ncbi:MAG: hypothetical protein J07HX64_02157 [halophilic archaeon J07HX64]|nr:MAG: hypothetical protein J07HX64_02157 [halophilic archaeon J07HX64]
MFQPVGLGCDRAGQGVTTTARRSLLVTPTTVGRQICRFRVTLRVFYTGYETGTLDCPREETADRVEPPAETDETERLPVSVRGVWVFGDPAPGFDPVGRLEVHPTKNILLTGSSGREGEFTETHGVRGIGRTVRVRWVDRYPSVWGRAATPYPSGV